jgi:hypothetical protein
MTDQPRPPGLLKRLLAAVSSALPSRPGEAAPDDGLTEDERAAAHWQQTQIDNLQQRTKGPFPPSSAL